MVMTPAEMQTFEIVPKLANESDDGDLWFVQWTYVSNWGNYFVKAKTVEDALERVQCYDATRIRYQAIKVSGNVFWDNRDQLINAQKEVVDL